MNPSLRFIKRVAILIAMIAVSSRVTTAQVTPNISIALDSVSLRDVGSDRVSFDLSVNVTSDTALEAKHIQFERMYMGSIPVYLNPLAGPWKLERGKPLHLDVVPLTVFYRDLDSLNPVIAIVRNQQATVTGSAHVQLDLNLLERLLLRQWAPTADLPISVRTSVEMPGGFLGQAAALASLSAAQFAIAAGGSVLAELRGSEKIWQQDLKARYLPALVTAESRYTLRTKEGRSANFVFRGLGFRISPDQVLLTDEMVHPWMYDVEAAAAMQADGATVPEDSRDLLVTPGTVSSQTGSARSLARKQIQVALQSPKPMTTNVPTAKGPRSVTLLRRDSPNNYCVVRFNLSEDKQAAMPPAAGESDAWDRLVMFLPGANGQLEMISTAAHRQNQKIVLDDPVDSRAFGSPLITPNGVVGMLQDEREGITWRASW